MNLEEQLKEVIHEIRIAAKLKDSKRLVEAERRLEEL